MTRYKSLGAVTIIFLAFYNLIQSLGYVVFEWRGDIIVYYLLHVGCITYVSFHIWRNNIAQRVYSYVTRLQRDAKIPKALVVFCWIVFCGNTYAVLFNKPIYPFYDVAMFRAAKMQQSYEKVAHTTRYCWDVNGEQHILNPRRDNTPVFGEGGNIWSSQFLGFSIAYHNKGLPQTYAWLKNKYFMYNEVYPIIEWVDFKSKKTGFCVDCSDEFQDSREYYGPLYFPD